MSKNRLMILPLLMLGIISLVLGPVTANATTGDTIFIAGSNGGDMKEMALKATKENGETVKNPDFKITLDNVIQIEQNDLVRVFDSDNGNGNGIEFTKARTIDTNDLKEQIDISSDGIIDFSGYALGVYTLDVVVDDSRAYEAIVVIGEQPKTEVDKIIKRETTRIIVDIDVDFDCGKGFIEKNGECIKKEKPSICYFNPMHKDCEPVDGKCPPGFGFNDDDRCIPQGKCPDGYGRAEDDETGTCFKKDKLVTCDDGSIRLPQHCRENEPIVDQCESGFELVNNVCQPIAEEPYGDCPSYGTYNPETGQCEDVPIEEEPLTPPITPEPEPEPKAEPTDELSVEEEVEDSAEEEEEVQDEEEESEDEEEEVTAEESENEETAESSE